MKELEAPQGKRAGAFSTADFLCIETYSGRGLLGRDPMGAQHFMASDASDQAIGLAVQDALLRSRVLSLDESDVFFQLENRTRSYVEWVDSLMRRYGYKTKRALFKSMKKCSIHLSNDRIVLSPTHHEKLEAWSGAGIKEEDHVVISAASAPEEIGHALKTAFSRCT